VADFSLAVSNNSEYFPKMKRNSSAAFTLVELMVVISIILVLAGLVAGIATFAQRKGLRARTQGEISMLSAACENYKIDNGSYPRDRNVAASTTKGITDQVAPMTNFLPRTTDSAAYQASSLFLYKELTGERTVSGTGVQYGVPDPGTRRYVKDMDPRILNVSRDPTTRAIIAVFYFQDPYGNCYGYSTQAALAQQNFVLLLKMGTATETPSATAGDPDVKLLGYNTGSFDLWSVGESKITVAPAAGSPQDLEWAKWIKNW